MQRSMRPSGFGKTRRFGGFRRKSAYRPPTFNPSQFIKKAVPTKNVEYIAKNSFDSFNFDPELNKNIKLRGYKSPTPIQDDAIPVILAGKDVVGIANTGTGKTAAFLLPLINKILLNRSEKVLIITPTRELAVQINDEFYAFSKGLKMFSALCIGGVSINRQIQTLNNRPNVVIGTPGRLKDLYQQQKIHFSDYSTIVLDEVDRMLDMGFVNDIREIVHLLPGKRHSLFFSATLPDGIKSIMRQFLNNPVSISVAQTQTSDNVNQDVVRIAGRSKIEVLHDLLIQQGFNKVLVFGRTKWGMERLSRELADRGFKTASIHGNKTQNQRQKALSLFKQNRIQVLIATDVASRGLDIDNVTHVINFDLPESYEDYIHRIGRTGRADKTGTALTFVD